MYNVKNRDSVDLQQQLRQNLEGPAKDALKQKYAYESKLIDDDVSKSTDEKIHAHRQAPGFYLLGTYGICIFSYFAYQAINLANGR